MTRDLASKVTTSTRKGYFSLANDSEATRENGLLEGFLDRGPNLRIYTFIELTRITKKFKFEVLKFEVPWYFKIASVYKGWVEETTLNPSSEKHGVMVSVEKISHFPDNNIEEWQSMVNFLGMLSHPNIVKLHGYCRNDEDFYLVHEWMPNDSLEDHLFKRVAQEHLSWCIRLKILIDIAGGLTFLHTLKKKVFYGVLLPSSILLDSNFNAKLSCFSLAIHRRDNTEDAFVLWSPIGYTVPEHVLIGSLSMKTAVFSYGILLLEMLTGQQAIDIRRHKNMAGLINGYAAAPSQETVRKLLQLLDPQLKGQYQSREVSLALDLATLGSSTKGTISIPRGFSSS